MERGWDLITGIIAVALAMKPGGTIQKLRRVLAEVLFHTVQIVNAPALEAPSRKYLHALLDLILPDSVQGRHRRHELQFLFTSDVSRDEIVWHSPGLLVQKWTWATRGAFALIPHKCEVFQRHRWVNSLGPVPDLALVFNVHNLGRKVFARWLMVLENRILPPIAEIFHGEPCGLSESEA